MATQAVKLRRVDREALERAIVLARASDPPHDRQIAGMLKTRPWIEVATFAAYACQDDALRLKAWQPPPCWMGDEKPVDDIPTAGRVAAWELRRRLIEQGLSMYEPDPVTSLERVEAQRRGDIPPTA
jgi:hypothetical protein